ncbi:hypothetical protein FLK61_25950 [Paenalkalicoccus suaedae]|uniref:DUF5666 domain-containing protein n=1 Tax=Paenalkalicoccus suaedae TaxID=2592382 RepID=A0A859FBK4_9BACI|nr:hypothetical protein [Paenalkalicoccus suaedae]QKS70208.1 hypothetical protein FLK61_25950 [Paenalkalicoccus suaedae]
MRFVITFLLACLFLAGCSNTSENQTNIPSTSEITAENSSENTDTNVDTRWGRDDEESLPTFEAEVTGEIVRSRGGGGDSLLIEVIDGATADMGRSKEFIVKFDEENTAAVVLNENGDEIGMEDIKRGDRVKITREIRGLESSEPLGMYVHKIDVLSTNTEPDFPPFQAVIKETYEQSGPLIEAAENQQWTGEFSIDISNGVIVDNNREQIELNDLRVGDMIQVTPEHDGLAEMLPPIMYTKEIKVLESNE